MSDIKYTYAGLKSLAVDKAKQLSKEGRVIMVHTNVGTHEEGIIFFSGVEDLSNFKMYKEKDYIELRPTELEHEEFYIGPEPFYGPETQVYLFEPIY
jgi:hypothetical protein